MKLLNLIIVVIFKLLLLSQQKTNATKADLYKRYPQLNGDTCSEKMNKMLTDVYSPVYQAMWQSSAKMVTDAGLMGACNNITDENGQRVAHYSNMQMNVTQLRGIARIGWCLPIECKTESLDYFQEKLFGFINAQLLSLPSYGINYKILIFSITPELTSQLGVRFTVPEEYNQLQQDSTLTGRRVMATLLIMLILASLGSNACWTIQWLVDKGSVADEKPSILPMEQSHLKVDSAYQSFQSEENKDGDEQNKQNILIIRGSEESMRSGKNIHINATARCSTNDMESRLTSIPGSPSKARKLAGSPQTGNILKQIFHYIYIVEDIYTRPKEKNLMPLSFIKFLMQFSILITITAYYLNVVTAENPWSMEVMFKSPVLMMVVAGGCVVDTFFTVASLLAFFNINSYLDSKQRDTLSLKEILQLYLKRFIRFVPILYLALFIGIYVMPWFGSGQDPLWHTFQQVLFNDCTEPKVLASKLLMYGNLYPSFQDDLNGCMQWTWTIECDMQLFLLTPWLVMLYRKIGSTKMYVLMSILFVAGLISNYYFAIKNKLTAGVFSMNNYYQYSYYNKPWNKISVYCLGIMSSMLYMDLKKPEKTAFAKFIMRNTQVHNGSFWKRHFPMAMFLIAMFLFWFGAFSSFPIQITPFAWSDSTNAMWYVLTRVGWAIAVMIIYFLVICGHNPTMLYFSTQSLMCLFCSLTWPAYILSPMIYMNMYSRVKEAIYMTMLSNCVLGMGGIMWVILICLGFKVVMECPIETMVSKTVRKAILGDLFKEKRDGILNSEKWWKTEKRQELKLKNRF